MAFSESLALRIRAALSRKKGIVEKRMFGGIGFLLCGSDMGQEFGVKSTAIASDFWIAAATLWMFYLSFDISFCQRMFPRTRWIPRRSL